MISAVHTPARVLVASTLYLTLVMSGSPDSNRVVVTYGDQDFRICGVEGDTVDDVCVGEFIKAHAVMSVPYVTMFVLCSTVIKPLSLIIVPIDKRCF